MIVVKKNFNISKRIGNLRGKILLKHEL